MKFDIATPPTESRCQVWKLRVWPATTDTKPVGVGIWVRLRSSENAPVAPVFLIWPGPV